MADTIYEMKLLQKEISVKEEQELRRLWREAFKQGKHKLLMLYSIKYSTKFTQLLKNFLCIFRMFKIGFKRIPLIWGK